MIGSAIQEHTSPDSLIQPALSASTLPGWLLNDRGGQFSKIDPMVAATRCKILFSNVKLLLRNTQFSLFKRYAEIHQLQFNCLHRNGNSRTETDNC